MAGDWRGIGGGLAGDCGSGEWTLAAPFKWTTTEVFRRERERAWRSHPAAVTCGPAEKRFSKRRSL